MSKKNLATAYAAKRKVKGYAKGGYVEQNGTTVKPNKGYGKIIIIDNEHEENDEAQKLAMGGEVLEDDSEQALDAEAPEDFLSGQEEPSILQKVMRGVQKRHMGR